MQILGIKEYGIKKYLAGTLKGGILPQSEEERYDLYLELMKKQYPGTYINLTPIWSSIDPPKEMKSYREFLEELKASNPEEYNRLMESSAQSETSEISKPWIDAEGKVRRSTNVGAGFVSGNDPIMQMYVEGVALNPVFKAIGTAGLYGLGKLGNNWARAKLISNTMNLNLRVPLVVIPGRNLQASIGNPVLVKNGTEYYMPDLLLEEVKRGKEAAAKFFEHPVVLLSYKHNLELAEKLGITIPNRPENIGSIIRQPVKIRWSGAPSNSYAAVSLTHLGDPNAVISYLWMPFDRKSFGITTIHENLHRGFYSAPLKYPNISKEYYDNAYKPLYSFYNWKTKKLLKPEYYDSYLTDISGGEAGPNFIDLGRDLGLKLGLKYPGYEAANDILQNYTGFKSWMIPLLNTSKAGMRHVWDAMTGKYFTIPAGGVLINHTILSNSEKAKLYLDGGSVKKVLTGMIPIYGTYQDAKEFINNPTLENFGWAVASGLGDVFFFTGLGAGLKGLKVANAARKAKYILKAKRADRLLDARRNYEKAKLGFIEGNSTRREVKRSLQSLGASYDNFRNMERKYNLATRAYNLEMRALGVKGAKEIGKDGVIQTTLYITE